MAQIILDSNNNLIQGDFDNATLNNRTKLQTTTTNATTNVYVVPNGSSTSAGVSVANNSSLTNASKIVMATNGSTDVQIISGVNGSGTYLPLSFYTNNALAAQITTAGNMTVTGTITQSGAPAFSAYRSTNQTITNNTWTKVALNAEDFDTNNNFDPTTNNRFTPTVAGYYQFNGVIAAQATSSLTRVIIALWKNNSQVLRGSDLPFSAGTSVVFTSVPGLIYMNGTTDFMELYVYLTGSGTLSLLANVGEYPTLSGFLARAA